MSTEAAKSPNALQWIVGKVKSFLEHVATTISDPKVREGILMDLGQPAVEKQTGGSETLTFKDGESLDLDEANTTFEGIDAYLKTADPSREATVAAIADLRALVAVLKNAFNVRHGSDLKGIVADVKAEFSGEGGDRAVERVLDALLQLCALNFLFRRYPAFFWIGQGLGLITDLATTDDLLPRLWSGGKSFLTDEPGKTRIRDDWLSFIAVGLAAGMEAAPKDFAKRVRMFYGWEGGPDSPTPIGDALGQRALSVSIDFAPEPNAAGEESTVSEARAIITMIYIPAAEGGPGTLFSFSGKGELQREFVPGWLAKLELTGASGFSVYLPENGDPVVDGPADASARLSWEQKPDPAKKPWVLPISGGTRLELGRGLVSLGVSRAGFEARLLAQKSAFILESGDDEILKRGLKSGTVRTEFDLGLAYSGGEFKIDGAAALQATLPVQKAVGPVDIRSVTLGIRTGDQTGETAADPEKDPARDLQIEASVTLVIKLGAVTLTLDRVGCTGFVDFGQGDAKADGGIDFKAPSGVGLKIDADAISGGGYLFHDPHLNQYAGVVELKISQKIDVKAVALLSRKIGDRPAFSLLLIITAEGFQPIDIGLGFRITGFGGLFGVDRSINTAALEGGVKTGALDALLFPRDPIGDAPRIVATAGTAFPPTADRNLLGAMVRIVWGADKLVTIDVAVILEFAGWSVRRIAVLGKVRSAFPKPEKPVVQIELDLVGTIDRDAKRAFAHLAITVGKIGTYSISGEAAMLYTWGDQKNYVISVGGFNPRFQKPQNFPALERVKFSLTKSKSVTVDATFYVALTSNSFQIGGSLDIAAKKSKFEIKGGLAIDALIQSQQPCYAFDLRANFELLMFGEPMFAVRFNGSLLGDKPWTISGKATFEIWIFDYTVDFSHTWGETEAEAPPPEVDVEPEILRALEDRRNWMIDLPAGRANPVVLRRADDGELRLHPLGGLEVRQRVVPLAVPLTRCGNARLRGASEFRIERVAIAGLPVTVAPVEESFAPAQFVDLTDDEKLSAPAFDDMQAGVRAAPAPLAAGRGVDVESDYVTKVFNPRTRQTEELKQPEPTLGGAVKGIPRAAELFTLQPAVRQVRLHKLVWQVTAVEPDQPAPAESAAPAAGFTASLATLHAARPAHSTQRTRLQLVRTADLIKRP